MDNKQRTPSFQSLAAILLILMLTIAVAFIDLGDKSFSPAFNITLVPNDKFDESGGLVTFSQDGLLMGSARGSAGKFYLRELPSRDLLCESESVRWYAGMSGIAISPMNDLVATAVNYSEVMLWRASDCTMITSFDAQNVSTGDYFDNLASYPSTKPTVIQIEALVFNPAGDILALGLPNGDILLWKALEGTFINISYAHSGPVRSLAFSPDGSMLASGSDDHTVKIWEIPSTRLIHSLTGHTVPVGGVVFTPGGDRVISTTAFRYANYPPAPPWVDENSVRIWDVSDGHMIAHYPVPSKSGDSVQSIALSPDGRILALGLHSGVIQFWNTSPLSLISTYENDMFFIKSLSFSPDGVWLAVGEPDQFRLFKVIITEP